jgi:hypothetical protein
MEEQLLLNFELRPDPGYEFTWVWDQRLAKKVQVQTLVYTGPKAKVSIVPDRPENTSPIYEIAEIRGMSVEPWQRKRPKLCACGCGNATRRLPNGEYRSYLPGHNRQKHWRGRHVA